MNLLLIDRIFIKATNKINTRLILLYLLQLFILKIKNLNMECIVIVF